jgi:hypothetical protein
MLFQYPTNRKCFTGAGLAVRVLRARGIEERSTAQESWAKKNVKKITRNNMQGHSGNKFFISFLLILTLGAGMYGEMKELEEEQPPSHTAKELTPEEEALLYGTDDEKKSDTDKDVDKDGDTDMNAKATSEEERRRKSEREAEEEDLRLQLAERNEGIRRRKAEKERRIKEQQEKEVQLLMAEKNRISEEAEAEKRAHKLQIERLEAELRKARLSSEQMEETDQGGNAEMINSKEERPLEEPRLPAGVGVQYHHRCEPVKSPDWLQGSALLQAELSRSSPPKWRLCNTVPAYWLFCQRLRR